MRPVVPGGTRERILRVAEDLFGEERVKQHVAQVVERCRGIGARERAAAVAGAS